MNLNIDNVIRESGIQQPPKDYIKKAFRISLLPLGILPLSILYFINPLFIVFIPMSIMASSLMLLSFILYPYIRRKLGSDRIGRHIIDIYGIMYSLSTLDIDRIFTVIVESLDEESAKPFKRYLYYRSVLGLNTVDSLRMASQRCPNRELRNTFDILSEAMAESGDLKNVFKHIFGKAIVERRSSLEKNIRASGLIGEFYITLNILLPIIMIVILIIFTIIGGNLFGINPIIIIPLTIYFIPVISAIFYLLAGD